MYPVGEMIIEPDKIPDLCNIVFIWNSDDTLATKPNQCITLIASDYQA